MINIDWFWKRVVNNKTQELGTIISTTHGGSGSYVTIIRSGDAVIEDIPLDIFNSDYSVPDINIDSDLLSEDIIEICSLLSDNFPGVINACRRFKEQKDYYIPGALVYFVDPGYHPGSKDLVGPRYPFKITMVHSSKDQRFSFLELASLSKLRKESSSSDVLITLDFQKMSPGSAALVLSRYDKLY